MYRTDRRNGQAREELHQRGGKLWDRPHCFTKYEKEMAAKIKNVDAVVIFTNKISHNAKREVMRIAKVRKIPVFMHHSCGICTWRDCLNCLKNRKGKMLMFKILKKWMIFVGLSFVAFNAFPINSFAYRPFMTEDAGVPGKGVTQLEVSWDYLKWNGDRGNVLLFVPIYGITERIELSAEIPYLFHNHEGVERMDGIGDINLVGKFLLLEEKATRPVLALKGAVKTKSGDEKKGLGSGDLDYSVVVIASKNFGTLALHGMFGYAFVGANGDDNVKDIYLYGLAADYGVTEKFHVVVEIAGNRHPDRTAPDDPLSGLLGFTNQVADKVILDGGVRYGFNDAVPKWNTTVGISITF